MKLVHSELAGAILDEREIVTELVIESPEVFREYIQELHAQCEKHQEGRFVLSEGEKELDFAKKVELILNPFALEINGRKTVNRLYENLTELAKSEYMYKQTAEMMGKLQEYLLELEQYIDDTLEFDQMIEMSALLKAVGMKYEESAENLREYLGKYLKIVIRGLEIRLVIFVNIRSFFDKTEIQELIQEMRYQEVGCLFIENHEMACLEGVKRYIIDKDKCEIY